jgi:hypothetical protein
LPTLVYVATKLFTVGRVMFTGAGINPLVVSDRVSWYPELSVPAELNGANVLDVKYPVTAVRPLIDVAIDVTKTLPVGVPAIPEIQLNVPAALANWAMYV